MAGGGSAGFHTSWKAATPSSNGWPSTTAIDQRTMFARLAPSLARMVARLLNACLACSARVGPTLGEQALQAFRHIAIILESEGGTLADVVHWRIAVLDGLSFEEGVAAFQQVWDQADPPPAITVHFVAGLGPGFLVEIDAVAVV